MAEEVKVHLTKEECQGIYDLIDELTGGNVTNCFGWDGRDSIEDTQTRAIAKIFLGCGEGIPFLPGTVLNWEDLP